MRRWCWASGQLPISRSLPSATLPSALPLPLPLPLPSCPPILANPQNCCSVCYTISTPYFLLELNFQVLQIPFPPVLPSSPTPHPDSTPGATGQGSVRDAWGEMLLSHTSALLALVACANCQSSASASASTCDRGRPLWCLAPPPPPLPPTSVLSTVGFLSQLCYRPKIEGVGKA